MTTQEFAQQILAIAHKALEQEKHLPVYIGDVSGKDAAHDGLEAIIKLCKEAPKDQDGYKQYEKKAKAKFEVSPLTGGVHPAIEDRDKE